MAAPNQHESGPIVYIDHSDVHEGCIDRLKAGIGALVGFVDAHQPQMPMYGFYFDDEARRMAVVSVHPDSASLERHLEVGAPEFRKLSPWITLRRIEVFGQLSDRAAELVRQKAAALGDGGTVMIREPFAGFDRLPSRPAAPEAQVGRS